MKRFSLKLEEIFSDIAFAEDGLYKEGRPGGETASRLWDRTFIAVAFAEAGEFPYARPASGTGKRSGSSGACTGSGRRVRLCSAHT